MTIALTACSPSDAVAGWSVPIITEADFTVQPEHIDTKLDTGSLIWDTILDTPDETSQHEETETPETSTPIDDTESTLSAGWTACGGEVPVECLIVPNTAGCPEPAGGCEWSACQNRRWMDARIDRAECVYRMCDVDPLHDLACLEVWSELIADCFANHCESNAPTTCGSLMDGALSECHL